MESLNIEVPHMRFKDNMDTVGTINVMPYLNDVIS